MSKRAISFITLSILLLLGYWFFTHFERVAVREYTGYQGEARYNSLLAAQRLLEQQGISTETFYSLSAVASKLTAATTLVLTGHLRSLNFKEVDQLLQWIEQGGHLVIGMPDNSDSWFDEQEPLLSKLGIIWQHADTQSTPSVVPFASQKFQINFLPYYFLISDSQTLIPLKWYADEQEANYYHVLHYQRGKGYVTLLSDLAFMTNKFIGEYDHAHFFLQLLHETQATPSVWLLLLQDIKTPSIWKLLWHYAPYLVISAVVMLLLWLWQVTRRFGSILPPPPTRRRRLLEHIEASGHFWWHHHQTEMLLNSLRSSLFKQLWQKYPEWQDLSQESLVSHLAEIVELSAENIKMALYYTEFEESAFISVIQTLIAMRKKLSTHLGRVIN